MYAYIWICVYVLFMAILLAYQYICITMVWYLLTQQDGLCLSRAYIVVHWRFRYSFSFLHPTLHLSVLPCEFVCQQGDLGGIEIEVRVKDWVLDHLCYCNTLPEPEHCKQRTCISHNLETEMPKRKRPALGVCWGCLALSTHCGEQRTLSPFLFSCLLRSWISLLPQLGPPLKIIKLGFSFPCEFWIGHIQV